MSSVRLCLEFSRDGSWRIEPDLTPDPKRISVLLNDQDKEVLRSLATLQGVSEMEAIRRAIRLAAELVEFQKRDGGRIVLEGADKVREVIRFL